MTVPVCDSPAAQPESSPRLALVMSVLLLVVVVLVGHSRQQRFVAPEPVPVEALQSWMLQSGHGIGPATAAHWLQQVQHYGPGVLPDPAREQLQGLIAEPSQAP